MQILIHSKQLRSRFWFRFRFFTLYFFRIIYSIAFLGVLLINRIEPNLFFKYNLEIYYFKLSLFFSLSPVIIQITSDYRSLDIDRNRIGTLMIYFLLCVTILNINANIYIDYINWIDFNYSNFFFLFSIILFFTFSLQLINYS